MAECSRIDTEVADQKKGDFIGSISHELRSPLHGILASAEFLSDELTEGFSKGLVETIDSCGRTLLDTINHVLDFSKINHFERSWRKNRSRGSRIAPRTNSTLHLRQADLPMVNLFADVDISVVCEEVVEGVFAGHIFQNITAKSFDMVPGTSGKMSNPQHLGGSLTRSESETELLQHPDVAVILDVGVHNYQLITQPGAFRRVLMNLLGNALKYTSSGYVQIKLEAQEIEDLVAPGGDPVARSAVTLTITDTGRGISPEFLRSKLFTPFAQENSLSSGTGLGLSIVRTIVALLEGDIEIDSELGHGTQVRVTLPLLRDMPKATDSTERDNSPKSNASTSHERDESISLLRSRATGQRVALYGFDIDAKDPIVCQTAHLLKASIANFLTNWYGLQVVPFGQRVNFIVANEANPATISKLNRPADLSGNAPSILVLGSHSSRFNRSFSNDKGQSNCGFVAKPVGPLKLARALLQLHQGVPVTREPTDPTGLLNTGSTNLSNVFEELSIIPEVLDSSRLAADSENARKVIESPTPVTVEEEKRDEFPFPVEENPSLVNNISMPGDSEAVEAASTMQDSESPETSIKTNLRSPRLLLVDDNKINLTLLRTYMRKRKYIIIDEAENGLEAVNKVREREEMGDAGYDIIFMDISMPILDGFGATREVRAIELERKKRLEAAETTVPSTALIIALTGLASSRDQREAFSSGVDLFLTKPVSLKEVGKMLDNWQANQEIASKR